MFVTLERAQEILASGGVVAVPTETVYGLAASISHPEAIQKIFLLKGRPPNNPLITHLASPKQASGFVRSFPKDFDRLAEAFWPGPLTLVVPVIEESLSPMIRAGLPTAAFRVPNHPMARELIRRTGPLVMPSANISGKPSSTRAEHVESDFGKDFPVIDGGCSEKGIESTILICEEGRWKIGRLGGISAEQIGAILGYFPDIPTAEAVERPLCPGQLYRHYAPNAALSLETEIPEGCSVIIGFAGRKYPASKRVKILGGIDDPQQAAQQLYQTLRELDEEGIASAWVDSDFPEMGLWASIRERLEKAARKS